MAKPTHLPKTIREDPEIQKIFGDSDPTSKRIKRTWKICENPNCKKKWFLPKRNFRLQRFCTPECCHAMTRKRPKRQTDCSQCGRHCRNPSALQLGQDGKLICYFCKRREVIFNREQKEQAKNPNKKKIYFKCDVCKSQVSRSFYEVNNGLCDECYSKKIGK